MKDIITKNEVERLYVQEDEGARIEVKVAYQRVKSVTRETYEVDIPGDGPRVIGRSGSPITTLDIKNVMLDVSIEIAGSTQKLVLGAREFKTMVAAVWKILPREPGNIGPIPFDNEEDL